MVDSYETNTLYAHQKAVGRLTASMGLTGSNNSSAFAQGIAELEERRLRDIQEYRIKIESELRDKMFSMYQNTGQEMSSAYQAYQIHIADKSTKLINFVQSFLSSYVSNLQTLYSSLDRAHSEQLHSIDNRGGMVAGTAGKSYVEDQATIERNRFSTLVNLINDKTQSFSEELQAKDLLSKVTQMAYIANKEYYDKKAELQYQKLRWDLDTFSYLGNFLGSPGSSVATTNGLTTGQSVMGAAAQGATIGSVGGLPGAAIGAVIGGGAALLTA